MGSSDVDADAIRRTTDEPRLVNPPAWQDPEARLTVQVNHRNASDQARKQSILSNIDCFAIYPGIEGVTARTQRAVGSGSDSVFLSLPLLLVEVVLMSQSTWP